jgi:hypothetical protein
MTQAPLFDGDAHARRTDPLESHLAAERATPHLTDVQDRVMIALTDGRAFDRRKIEARFRSWWPELKVSSQSIRSRRAGVPNDLNAGRGSGGGQAGDRTTSGILYTDSDRMDALIVAAAAEAAEKYIGMDSDGFESDRHNAAKLALEVSGDDPDKAMKLNAQAEALARRLVVGDRFQGLCTRLSEYLGDHALASGEEMYRLLRTWDNPPEVEVRSIGFGRWAAFRRAKREHVSNRKDRVVRVARDGQRVESGAVVQLPPRLTRSGSRLERGQQANGCLGGTSRR